MTVNIDESLSGGDKYHMHELVGKTRDMKLNVELSDYVHTVKSKIASKILEAKHRWMASWSHKIVKKMEDKELKKGWNLYTSEGTHLQDYFTLADYDIENNATICIFKDRVFGTKWVDVGNEVPRSLIEIICPELAKLLAKEDKGGIVDLEHSEKVKAQFKAVEEKQMPQPGQMPRQSPAMGLQPGQIPQHGQMPQPGQMPRQSPAMGPTNSNYLAKAAAAVAEATKSLDFSLSQNHCIRADNRRYDDMIT